MAYKFLTSCFSHLTDQYGVLESFLSIRAQHVTDKACAEALGDNCNILEAACTTAIRTSLCGPGTRETREDTLKKQECICISINYPLLQHLARVFFAPR